MPNCNDRDRGGQLFTRCDCLENHLLSQSLVRWYAYLAPKIERPRCVAREEWIVCWWFHRWGWFHNLDGWCGPRFRQPNSRYVRSLWILSHVPDDVQALSLVWKIRKILDAHVFALLKPLINPPRVLQVGGLQRLPRSIACLCIASSWSHSQRTLPSWHKFLKHEVFWRTLRWDEFLRHVDLSNDL